MSGISFSDIKEAYQRLVSNAVKPSNISLEDDIIPQLDDWDVDRHNYMLTTDRGGVSSGSERYADELKVQDTTQEEIEFVGSVIVEFEMSGAYDGFAGRDATMDITVTTYDGRVEIFEEKVAERVNIGQESAQHLAVGPNYQTYREKTNKAVHNAIIDLIVGNERKKQEKI